jgi:riboflavin kinase/FMN adenylyltransferase
MFSIALPKISLSTPVTLLSMIKFPPSSHLIRSIESIPDRWRGGVLSIGNFDGVHCGHRALIRQVKTLADGIGTAALVFTFDPPPLKLLRPTHSPIPLTWMERRADLLHALGIDTSIAYPTTHALLELEAEVFFEKILVEGLGIRGLVEGSNFRFGKDRRGDIKLIERLCAQHGIAFELAKPELDGNVWYSSSLVREWIEQGEIDRANSALVEPYRLIGDVGHGAARGRLLGFPTANLQQIPVLIPAHGVYAARVVFASESVSAMGKPVALHIGPNPTFDDDTAKVEAHLIGFTGDLYGQTLELEILGHVRGVQRFQSKEALLDQLQRDVQRVLEIVSLLPAVVAP